MSQSSRSNLGSASAVSVRWMINPLHGGSSSHGKRAIIRSKGLLMGGSMDRFPCTNFPQNGRHCDSSVVPATPTWVITRMEDSQPDGRARFFQIMPILQPGGMGWNGSVPFRRILLLSCAGLNFTQEYRFLSETFVKASWLGQWRKVHEGRTHWPTIDNILFCMSDVSCSMSDVSCCIYHANYLAVFVLIVLPEMVIHNGIYHYISVSLYKSFTEINGNNHP